MQIKVIPALSLAHNHEYKTTRKNSHMSIIITIVKKFFDFLYNIQLNESSIKYKQNVIGMPQVKWNYNTEEGNCNVSLVIDSFLF